MASLVRERESVPEAHRWNLEDLFSSQEALDAEWTWLVESEEMLGLFQGHMGDSPDALAEALKFRFEVLRRLSRVSSYASRLYHQDMRHADARSTYDRVNQLATRLDAAMAYMQPELLALPPDRLSGWMRLPALQDFSEFLRHVLRRRGHTRSSEVEQVLAQSGDLAQSPYEVFQTMVTVNFRYPAVTLSDGSVHKLTPATYTALRSVPNREDRELIFSTFWQEYSCFQDTFAGLLATKLHADRFYARARGYATDLEASLGATEVPTSIYRTMIAQVRKGLPSLWKYLDLRKKAMKVPSLRYHDQYAVFSVETPKRIPYEEALVTVVDALAPLGPEYAAALRAGLFGNWTDVYPTPGKRSGAYSSGEAYDVHPYVLLNYTEDYSSMSTLAHEFGHALHSWFSNKSQPYAKSQYPTFVAEVASTLNENLLRLFLLNRERNQGFRRYLLEQALENFRTTVFRQAMLAEFELALHGLVEAGEPPTAKALNDIYLGLLKEYYGHAQGVTTIDDIYQAEWSFIPHFYYNFYMFQYTTSFVAAATLADKLASGDAAALSGYVKMLSAGGSKSPVELLGLTGIDLSQAAPYQHAFSVMDKLCSEMEHAE